jgi:hypothetical protein
MGLTVRRGASLGGLRSAGALAAAAALPLAPRRRSRHCLRLLPRHVLIDLLWGHALGTGGVRGSAASRPRARAPARSRAGGTRAPAMHAPGSARPRTHLERVLGVDARLCHELFYLRRRQPVEWVVALADKAALRLRRDHRAQVVLAPHLQRRRLAPLRLRVGGEAGREMRRPRAALWGEEGAKSASVGGRPAARAAGGQRHAGPQAPTPPLPGLPAWTRA